ncbi:WD40 repeat-like protein [Russula compacta]|nr:WD40 repeat-like protein [Russula compacta]
MSLLESATLVERTAPLISSSLPCDAYVLAIAAFGSYYAASTSAPSHRIYLFDKTSCRTSQSFEGHRGGTTSLRAADSVAGVNKRLIISSGKDGVVRVWDDRTGATAIETSDGLTVAAGTELQQDDAIIVYWDPRHPAAPLRKHTSTHSDDITSVHFSRSSSEGPRDVLLSGSTDGLVCISNADEEDEEEAVVYVGNLGSSISQAGWMPRRAARTGAWAATDMETFSLWSDELDLKNDLDICAPSAHTQARTWVTDYLVGCHASEESGLSVLVGSNEGDVALLRNADFHDRASPWSLERLWTGHHKGVVRSALLDERANVLLTGGEDANFFAWSCAPLPKEENDMTIDGSFSPSLLAKRDHEGDVEMSSLSPTNKKFRYL